MEDKIAEINSRVANSFSKVKHDINDIKRSNEGIRKEFAERFIDKSDYVKLFTEYSNLKKEHSASINDMKNEHSALIAELRNELYKTTNDIKAASKKQIDALEKKNEALKKSLYKELAKKANDKETKKLKKELMDSEEQFNKFTPTVMDKNICETELAETNKKLDTTLEELNSRVENKLVSNNEHVKSVVNDLTKKMNHLLSYSVDVNDVESNFVTQKKISKELETIKKQLYKKGTAQKEIADINNKIIDLRKEMDEIGEILKLTTYTLQETAKMKDVEQEMERFTDKVELEKEIKRAEAKISEIKKSIDDFKVQVNKSMSRESITQADVEKIQEDLVRIKENMLLKKEVEKVLTSNAIKMDNLKKDFEWVEEKIKQLFRNVDDTTSKSENRHLLKTKDIEGIKKKVEELINHFSRLSAKSEEIDKLSKDLSSLNNGIGSLKKELDDKTPRKDSERLHETLSGKISSLRNDLDSIEDSMKRIEKTKTITVEVNKDIKAINSLNAKQKEKQKKKK